MEISKENTEKQLEPNPKVVWKWSYILVLLANAVYIYLFYLLMENLS